MCSLSSVLLVLRICTLICSSKHYCVCGVSFKLHGCELISPHWWSWWSWCARFWAAIPMHCIDTPLSIREKEEISFLVGVRILTTLLCWACIQIPCGISAVAVLGGRISHCSQFCHLSFFWAPPILFCNLLLFNNRCFGLTCLPVISENWICRSNLPGALMQFSSWQAHLAELLAQLKTSVVQLSNFRHILWIPIKHI